jgi:hypothetical protein
VLRKEYNYSSPARKILCFRLALHSHSIFIGTLFNNFFLIIQVTEKEIFNGILSKGRNLSSNVLYFEREIEGIYDQNVINKNINLAKKFVDLDKNNRVDKEAKELLDALKYEKVTKVMPESNRFKFNVKWDTKAGISRETHSEYIKEFGEVFYEQTRQLIDKNQNQERYIEQLGKLDTELLQEVLDHANFCNDTVEKFQGRQDYLRKVSTF